MTDQGAPVTEAQLKHALEQERDHWQAENQANRLTQVVRRLVHLLDRDDPA